MQRAAAWLGGASAAAHMSAVTVEPSRMRSPATVPSVLVMISATGEFFTTLPPRLSMLPTMGAHRRSGWLPSRKAICRPSSSLRKRFIAVSTCHASGELP